MDITPGKWRYPQWVCQDEDFWFLMQDGQIVGEVYRMVNDAIKWHCKTSDWRDTNADTIDQAKAECEASFWKDAWEELRKRVLA